MDTERPTITLVGTRTPRGISTVMVPMWIYQLQDLFGICKNPLFAWRAYSCARKHGLPTPEWVLGYLDKCAQNLAEGGTGESATKIVAALGMTTCGKGNIFTRFEVEMLHNHAVDCVSEILGETGGKNIMPACEEVAAFFYSELGQKFEADTIRSWYISAHK